MLEKLGWTSAGLILCGVGWVAIEALRFIAIFCFEHVHFN